MLTGLIYDEKLKDIIIDINESDLYDKNNKSINYKYIAGITAVRSILDRLEHKKRIPICQDLRDFLPEKLNYLILSYKGIQEEIEDCPLKKIKANGKSYVLSLVSGVLLEIPDLKEEKLNDIKWVLSAVDMADAILISLASETILVLEGPPGIGKTAISKSILEYLGIKYTGCRVQSSAICMDKIMTKKVLSTVDIPLINSVNVNKDNYKEEVKKLKFPLIIKPANEGSSIGMTKVNKIEELDDAMKVALECDKEILIEEYLTGESATVGVLERKTENGSIETFATPILGFKTKTEWYDYEAKYTKGLTEFILPANFDKELTEKIQNLAILAHKTCGCSGVSRVDFLVSNNIPYILEINTNPGMTDTSDLPAQANEMGINYNELVELILKSAEIK